MPFPCRAHAVPLPCRAAKGLECVFPIWFTQCGRVWFTLAMPFPCHALTMPFFSRPQHTTAVSRRPCCACAVYGRETTWVWHGHGMLCVNGLYLDNRDGEPSGYKKIQIIEFLFENRLHWQFEFWLLLFAACTGV